ncbi:MAG: 4-hydroxythreonine-4-phosphate dehydrogenase PdxA [Candidatus Latescibacteria bacterium]|nr:4-hydroxythreonine-4-phosphate dehydrogenase PdxA [Candidatus Latescibacterota bacterium]
MGDGNPQQSGAVYSGQEQPRLLITMGDPAGVGPEVVLKALPVLVEEGLGPIGVVGPPVLWELAAAMLGLPRPQDHQIHIVVPESLQGMDNGLARDILFCGERTTTGASVALECLETAAEFASANPQKTAVITAPVNKRALHDAGVTTPGLTEWFGERFDSQTPLMLLVGGRLRVAVATTHIPLREVPSALTVEGIAGRLSVLHEGLRAQFGVDGPRIALLALNPHGGTGAEEDREEREVLEPAMLEARSGSVNVDGLFSADAFFGRRRWELYDAVMAPYHDQGLTAVKIEAGGMGVNVTLGLPVVRTSPDHGTAFDIAGKGVAGEGATVAAVRLADALLDGRGAR